MVVPVPLELVEDLRLRRSSEQWLHFYCTIMKPARMQRTRLRFLTTSMQQIEPVLANRLQHLQARFGLMIDDTNKALFRQVRNVLQSHEVTSILARPPTDRFRGREIRPA